MTKTPFEYLEAKVHAGTWLNDNHNNYDFLDFWDKYCPAKPFESAKRKFHYEMSKLVSMGMCKKTHAYLNNRDFNNFGRRTIINYQPII